MNPTPAVLEVEPPVHLTPERSAIRRAYRAQVAYRSARMRIHVDQIKAILDGAEQPLTVLDPPHVIDLRDTAATLTDAAGD